MNTRLNEAPCAAYNKNATAELSRLELAFSQVKAELFDRLHTLIRDDIFDEARGVDSSIH